MAIKIPESPPIPQTRCSYQAQFFNHEIENFDTYHCEELTLPNQSFCFFHSPTSNASHEEFASRIAEKIVECMNGNRPILLIGYIFPYKMFLKAMIHEGDTILFAGSLFKYHIRNLNDNMPPIYTPNLEPGDHQIHISVPIYFTNATFKKGLEIGNIHLGTVDFNNVTFEDETYIALCLLERSFFQNCNFNNYTNFVMARMLATDFTASHFYKNAKFTGAILHKSDFTGAKFDGFANFATMWCYESSNFSNITCNDDATFSGTKFFGLSFFHYSVFKKRVNFEEVVFLQRSNFNNVVFEEGDKATFNASNLSMITFARTDITRVNFGDVQWRQGEKYKIIDEEDLEWSFMPVIDWAYLRLHKIDNNHNLIRFLGHNGIIDNNEIVLHNENETTITIFKTENAKYIKIGSITIAEEDRVAKLELENFSYNFVRRHNYEKIYYPLKVNIQSVLAIYRNLRENYEYRLRYEEAGKFFLREMELKRKYGESFKNNIRNYYEGYDIKIKNKIGTLLSLTGIYYITARYGESILIPVVVGILIIGITTLIFALQVNPFLEFSIFKATEFHQLANTTQLGIAFDRSLTDFMPLFFGNPKYGLGAFDYAIKLLGGVFTFGFVAIALRRRFERKIRH